MKKVFGFILFAALWIAACGSNANSSADSSTPWAAAHGMLPHSMKGYELYSWQTQAEWHFTLITGTNRQKSPEEITTGQDTTAIDGWVRISVQGVDALKVLLNRLPQNEEIFWVGPRQFQAGNIDMPPQQTIAIIKEYCRQVGLTLAVNGD